MARRLLLVALILLATGALLLDARAASAAASPSLSRVLVVGRAAADAGFTDAPTEARQGDAAELAVVGVGLDGGKTVYFVDDDVAPLTIGGKAIAAKARRAWDTLGAVCVRWSQVEPHAWREEGLEAPNGSATPYYSNVATGGKTHGEWLGYDAITYFETPLGTFVPGAAARRIEASARPPRADEDVYDGLGTMRYKVEIRVPGSGGAAATIVGSPGKDAVDAYGILRSVHRVSIRKDDSVLGWLTAYFMVPEVFGSAGPGKNHQTERWVGADCADVLLGAYRAAGHRKADYTSVASLTTYAKKLVEPISFDAHARPEAGATPPTGVKAGDIIRIDYGGAMTASTPRSWDHVAVLYEDRSDPDGPDAGAADGILDGFDLVVHMGHPRLVLEPLASQLPAKLDVLRWKP
jgi:hypothetical protein